MSAMVKFQHVARKLKTLANSNLWNKTNGAVVFIFGTVAVAADALEIKEKLFGKDVQLEQIIEVDSIQDSKVLADSSAYALKPKKTPVKFVPKNTISTIKKVPKVIYFNEDEFLLENSGLALFIKNGNNQLDMESQQRLSDAFLGVNINATSTFFTKSSLKHYNQFYSANHNFLRTTKIASHVKKYLIGTLRQIKSTSSIDADISIVHLKFQGKLVDVSNNTSKTMSKEVRESNYQQFRALEDALEELSKEITKEF